MFDIPSLGACDLHLLIARDRVIDDRRLLQRYCDAIAPDERQRAGRFHFARDRQQFIVSRVLLREALTAYQPGTAPHEWTFEIGAAGRPTIASRHAAAVWFNMSHCDGMIVIAVARHPRVGVDVEWLDRRFGAMGPPTRFLTAEEKRYISSDVTDGSTERRFLEVWTLKEAYVKALGLGLAGMDNVSFSLATSASEIVARSAGNARFDNWHFKQLVIDRHIVAVAIERDDPGPLAITAIDRTPNIGGQLSPADLA